MMVRMERPTAQRALAPPRRLAMRLAAELAGDDGVLLTTDADSIAPPDWVMRNIQALEKRADVVCGRAVIDPVEARIIPMHLHEDDARECRLIALLDTLAWMLDPEWYDAPPRHTEASGASLAVTVDAYRRVGGIPAIAAGEDRAFVRALWRASQERRRDGAYQWELFEDPSTDGRFIETFLTDSWLEHLRSHERVTKSDRIQEQIVWRFQVDGQAPKTTHLLAVRSEE